MAPTTTNGSGPYPLAPQRLVDQYGQPFPATDDPAFASPVDPLDGMVRSSVVPVYRDVPALIAAGNPGSPGQGAWTIGELRQALIDHQTGQFALAGLLTDSVVGDDRVQATLGSRTAGLFGQPITHAPSSEDDDSECIDAWARDWRYMAPQSTLSEIMRWGVMMGFCVVEILWDTTREPWRPFLKPWHAQNIYYRWDLRKYYASTLDGPIEITPGNGKWMLFAPHGPYRGWMQGAIRATAQPWFLRQLAFRDWARYSERHGLPMIMAKVPAMGDAKQKQAWIQTLSRLGPETAMILPQLPDGTSYDLGMLEATDRSWQAFKGLIEQCDRSLILPILWQNLTTEVKEGSFAAARVHGDVRQSALEFDNSTLSECIYEQLARPYAWVNFGDPELAPTTTWNIEPAEDMHTMSMALQAFATAIRDLAQAGYKIEPDALIDIAKRYGVRLPKGSVKDAPPISVGIGGGK